MTENLSAETLADDPQLRSADGGATVESPALTLVELNKYLGSDFKDTSTALKALKDTKDFVGRRKEDIVAEVRASLPLANVVPDESLKSDVQSLKRDLFFSQNLQFKGYESLISKLGSDPAEVVKMKEFTDVFEKVKAADEVANSKSVVSSNSRLSQTKSTTDEAVAVANARGTTNEDVALVLARGIMEATKE